ncbi:biotin-dependent carboxyltransferase family protein [Herbiconiux sp. A18JL235]|uniref:Biotin-dependent carboxyltransferase family protein n=1 Tax=Herbiconiux sp. A18JL235 TaxID=3152363 RepID=A0AB39BB71_9MICO
MRGESVLEVLATGPFALVQDRGRAGHAHLGVTGSGAADRAAAAAANRLVGNLPDAAVIEMVSGGLSLRVTGTVLLATAGAPGTVRVDRGSVPQTAPRLTGRRVRIPVQYPVGWSVTAFAGDVVTVLPPERGLRSYLAVRGGVAVERVLGSRSTDVLSGLGPAPLAPGDRLPLGDENGAWPAADFIPPALPRDGASAASLHIVRGPRDDWFGDDGWRRLLEQPWVVGVESNRVGVRLEGAHPLEREVLWREVELPSEGMVAGAVQVPPGGELVVFGRDHPVTGGYPVIGVIDEPSLDLIAQLRPGDQVRFGDQPKSIAASLYRR